MKKFIALLMVLIVLGGVGFAEVAVTGQVDTVVMPLEVVVPDGQDPQIGAAVGRNGSTDATRVRIGIAAGTDEVGINFKVQFNPNATVKFAFDDFAEVWWKPISPLKIEAGKFVNDTLRGKIGDDNWNKYTAAMKDADSIFSRFKSTSWGTDNASAVGFMLGINPIEPLYIGVSVPSVYQLGGTAPDTVSGSYTTYTYDKDKAPTEWKKETLGNVAHTYEKIQAGAGYTIANIGVVRAQYVGASFIFDASDTDKVDEFVEGPAAWSWWKNPLNVRRIEAAFAFTGLSGLVLDVGAKLPMTFDTYEVKGYDDFTDYVKMSGGPEFTPPVQVSLGVGYTLDALDIKGRVDAQFLGSAKNTSEIEDKYDYTLGPDINLHLWPSYKLDAFSEGLSAGLDLGFEFIGESKLDYKDDATPDVTDKGGYKFGIGAWLRKAYGGASIKGGLALSLGEVNEKKQATVFSIPVIFDYTF